jgi:hypothetical protein
MEKTQRLILKGLRDAESGELPTWDLLPVLDENTEGVVVPELRKLLDDELIEPGEHEWEAPIERHDLSAKATTELDTDCFRLTDAGRATADDIG